MCSGVSFYLAWAFKQSQVAMLAGVLLYLAVGLRSWSGAARVAVPFGLLVGVTLLAGTDWYR